MDYSFYLKQYTPNIEKLEKFGFKKINDQFVLHKNLKTKGLYAVIKISTQTIDINVIDSAFNDEYIPFNIKNINCVERVEVENFLDDIAKICFNKIDLKNEIVKYTFNKYKTKYETPWEDTPDYYTFKTEHSKKWYAIIMHIKKRQIKLDGEDFVDIINVKLPPNLIIELMDNKHFFPAYHMNKTYWITILLDKQTNLEKVKQLIDISCSLVEK